MIDMRKVCRDAPMIPVMVIEDIADAVPLAKALIAGGLDVLEITLRTDCALRAIEKIAAACPEAMVGAGSLRVADDVQDCLNAGARFGVSPGAPRALLDAVIAAQFPFLPGATTPTEAMTLAGTGFSVLKFFPAAAAGGIPMLKSIAAPLPNIAFCPTGGISLDNARDYLALPNVATVGGSWVVPQALIAKKEFDQITKIAEETVAVLSAS